MQNRVSKPYAPKPTPSVASSSKLPLPLPTSNSAPTTPCRTMRDRLLQISKKNYPDITPRDDAEIITLAGGTFKGKPEEFPAYMEWMLNHCTRYAKPDKVASCLAGNYASWKRMLDKPFKAVGVRDLPFLSVTVAHLHCILAQTRDRPLQICIYEPHPKQRAFTPHVRHLRERRERNRH